MTNNNEASSNVRWRIIALLVGFSLVSYILRMNISIAAQFMMPELDITQIQMGQIFSAFLLGYALFQIPLGVLGDRLGSGMLVTLGVVWAVLTVLSGLLPGVVFGTGTAAFVLLVVVRFVLGVTIAGVYPISALTVAKWQPVTQRAFSYSFIVAGVFIGSAATPPIVAWLMVTLGWRESFYLVSVFGVAAALTWKFYGANHPREHPDVSPGELALITEGREPAVGPPPVGAVWWTLRNPSVLFLSASYFLAGYVLYTFIFWFFTYLVEERQFTLLEGGVYASLPFIAAGILSPVGGAICDWSTMRFGQRWGRRLTAFTGPILAGALLFWGARTENVILAICALALSFGFQEFAEAAYWSTTMDISGRMTGAATGILNTANNLGGVVSTALMPVLVQKWGWVPALDSCSLLAVVSAVLWLGVRPDQPIEVRQAKSAQEVDASSAASLP